ncbi:indolepyruvate oxidoreductase subunit beta [candidate division KSB1 bacterium]
MKQDIIVAGVGGQGILSIAFVFVNSALQKGMNSKQSEVHGMSQRGGPVFAYIRISDEPIFSDLIPVGEADMIIGLEAMESLRYADYLKEGGYLIVDQTYMTIDNYNSEAVDSQIRYYPKHILIQARRLAKEAGNILAANMVMAGVACPFLEIEASFLKDSIRTLFAKKTEEVINVNLKAFDIGIKLGRDYLKMVENQ